MSATQYLKRRRGKRRSGYRWYVRVQVPRDLRDTLRTKTIERGLNTSDLKEAQKLRHAALAQIFAGFDRARQRTLTSADIEHEAQRYLKERFEAILKNPGGAFTTHTDSFGVEYPRGGEIILPHLYDALEEDLFSRGDAQICHEFGQLRLHHVIPLNER